MAGLLVSFLGSLVVVFPLILAYTVPVFLQIAGIILKTKTAGRREAIFDQYQQPSQDKNGTGEEGWEKIEKREVATPNLKSDWTGIVGFFHPFCNAGGGGERLLWAAVAATQRKYPKAICAVYTGDHEIQRTSIVTNIKDRFDITLQESTLQFVYLSKRDYVLASMWPRFTLLGQSLGSLILAFDAFSMLVPDIFIDTMGYAFSVALSSYLFPSVPTAAYVHYPTISTDMLSSLDDTTGEKGIHSGLGTGWKGKAKRTYWLLFAKLYSWAGSRVGVVMTNSTWTFNHIDALWRPKHGRKATIVYPPCPVEELTSKIEVSASSEARRENTILYIAQFRPEKNHAMILRAFSKYVLSLPENDRQTANPQLVLIGSVRANTPDERHIYSLRLLARELKIQDCTAFITDAPFSLILEHLQKASVSVNGMYNEHFGIGNVEGLAAGLIPVVHNSGGPKLDIVIPYKGEKTGFHAENDQEYADAFALIGAMSSQERLAIRLRGRESSKRFSEVVFDRLWYEQMDTLVQMVDKKK